MFGNTQNKGFGFSTGLGAGTTTGATGFGTTLGTGMGGFGGFNIQAAQPQQGERPSPHPPTHHTPTPGILCSDIVHVSYIRI